jgi:O-antigen ligase
MTAGLPSYAGLAAGAKRSRRHCGGRCDKGFQCNRSWGSGARRQGKTTFTTKPGIVDVDPVGHRPAMVLGKRLQSMNHARPSAAMAGMVVLVVMTFIFGGSARGDEPALLAYRPLSVIILGLGLWTLQIRHIRAAKFLCFWFTSLIAVTLMSLVPLPPSIWQALPGREIVVEIDRTVILGSVWRPLSITPELTRNAFWSLMGPFAAFILAMQLSKTQILNVFSLVFWMVWLSGLISVLQITQGPDSAFYLYRVTNYGQGVGLFANRNHQAVLLACQLAISFIVLPPVAMRIGRKLKLDQWGLTVGLLAINSVFLILLIIVTGSRSGIILGFLAMIFAYFSSKTNVNVQQTDPSYMLDRMPAGQAALRRKMIMPIVSAVAVASVIVAVLAGRDVALDRLSGASLDTEGRAVIISTLIDLATLYFPFGSGIGSFDPVFRMHEPYESLAPTYWNHAHNDWLEVLVTSGVFGICFVIAIIIWLALKIRGQGRAAPAGDFECQNLRVIGFGMLLLVSLSSFVEYPLRVPIIACIMSIALVALDRGFKNEDASTRKQ